MTATIDEIASLLVESAARAHAFGYEGGYHDGRADTLCLAWIGAACAHVIYDHWADVNYHKSDWYAELTGCSESARETMNAIANALAASGVEVPEP